jgi:hypothetical protein
MRRRPWFEGRFACGQGEGGEWRVVDHHREMKNATQRLRTGTDLGEKPLTSWAY